MVTSAAATKTCSHCGHSGHNSRTCLNGVNKGFVKLFGVNISSDPITPPEETPLRKTLSLGNQANNNGDFHVAVKDSGYHSDGKIISKKGKAARAKKKGKPWMEEQHRAFLAGLKRLGKGDWKGIATGFVPTRTSTQVASHAQKYYMRSNANNKKKRRGSLFDISLEDQKEKQQSFQVDASSSRPLSKQPITISQEPAQDQTQTRISNQFQNLSMENRPIYRQQVPPYYNFSPYMVQPMYYANPQQLRFTYTHPSGIPVPRHVPTITPRYQPNAAWNMTKKNGLELDLGLPQPQFPSPRQATGATHFTAHGVIRL